MGKGGARRELATCSPARWAWFGHCFREALLDPSSPKWAELQPCVPDLPLIEIHNVCLFVDAFAMRSVIRFPNTSALKKCAARVKITSTLSATKIESKLNEINTPDTTVEPDTLANVNEDRNEDADINSMMNETVTTKKVEDVDSENDDLMEKIKESGVAGVISYALWELAFWTVSVPVCVLGYKEVTG